MKLCTAIGRLTRQPIAVTDLAYPRAFATIACEVRGHSAEAATEFVDLVLDGTIATVLLTHARTGDRICVNGNEHSKTFSKRDGTVGFTNEIYVFDFDFIGRSGDRPGTPANAPRSRAAPPPPGRSPKR